MLWFGDPATTLICLCLSVAHVREPWRPCYHSHPSLSLGCGLVIYGGSCVRPTIEDADIYIGFDAGMQLLDRSTGWTSAQQVLYAIPDTTRSPQP